MSRALNLLPILVTPDQARTGELIAWPLFDAAPEDAPVIALAEDGEPLTEERLEALGLDPDEALEDAIEELADQSDAGWIEQSVPVKGGGSLTILARHGEGAAAEEILVPEVLEEAREALGAEALAVAVPARGMLLVTDAAQKWQLVAAFAAAARMQHAAGGEGALFPGVLRAEDGRLTGVIDLRTASLDAAARRGV